jgi:hypothetical protein
LTKSVPGVVLGGVLVTLAACSDPVPPVETEGPSRGAPAEDTAPADVRGVETGTRWAEETAGGASNDALEEALFATESIHTVAIDMPAETFDALAASPYEWAVAEATVDGVTLENVGVRLRGKIGSYRDMTGKPKFKVKFNQYVEDQRLYGLEEISLDNTVVDCTYLKEVVGWHILGQTEVPALRAAFAAVTVNDVDYGLYVLIEPQDDRFLARSYELPDGNLYDGKYVWYGGWSYTLLDFGTGVDSYFSLEEGTDVGNADITAVSNAVLGYANTPEWPTGTGAVVDWAELHAELAAEQYIGHNDGYALNTNNYRVYFDPADGKAEIIPWDFDYTFLNDYDWGMSWASPRGTLAAYCWRDAACLAEQQLAMADLLARLDVNEILAFYDEMATLTYDAAYADPRRECSADSIQSYRDSLRAWVEGQPDRLRSAWGL